MWLLGQNCATWPKLIVTIVVNKSWMEKIRQDIGAKGLSERILLDRNEWRKLIHVPDPA